MRPAPVDEGAPLLAETSLSRDDPDGNRATAPTVALAPAAAYGAWSVDAEQLRRLTRGKVPTAARLDLVVASGAADTCFVASPIRVPFSPTGATWACAADDAPGDGVLGCDASRRWGWRGRPDGDARLLPSFGPGAKRAAASGGRIRYDVLDDVLKVLAGTDDQPFGWALASSGAAEIWATESEQPPVLRLAYGDRDPGWEPLTTCEWHGFHRVATAHGQSNVIVHGPPGVVYGGSGVIVYVIDEATDAVIDQFATFDKIHALQWVGDGRSPGSGMLYIGNTHDGLVVVDTDATGRIIGEVSHYAGPAPAPELGAAPAVEALRIADACPDASPSRRAYLADGNGLDIVDVTRPLLPVRVGALADPRAWYSSAIAFEEDCSTTPATASVYLGRAGARSGTCVGETDDGPCLRPNGSCACVWSKVDVSDPAAPALTFTAPSNWANVALDMEIDDGRLIMAANGGLLTCGTKPESHACAGSPRHRTYGETNWPTWLNLDDKGRLVVGYFPQPTGGLAYLGLLSEWLPAPRLPACGQPGATCGPARRIWGDNTNDGVVVGDIPSDPVAARFLVSHDDYGIVKVDPTAAELIRTVVPGGVVNSAVLDGGRILVADLLFGGAEYTVDEQGSTVAQVWSRPGFERARGHSFIRDVAATEDVVVIGNGEGAFLHARSSSGELSPLPQPGGTEWPATAVAARQEGAQVMVYAAVASEPPSVMAWSWTATDGAKLVAQAEVATGPGTTWDLELTGGWLVAAGASVPLTLLPASPAAGAPWQAAVSCKGWGNVPHLALGELPGFGELLFLVADSGLVVTRVDQLERLGIGQTCVQDPALSQALARALGAEGTPKGVTSVAFDHETHRLLVGYGPRGDHPSDVVAVDVHDPANPVATGTIDLQESITSLDAGGGLVAVTSADLGTAVYRAW